MKGKGSRKPPSRPKGNRKGKRFSINEAPIFSQDSKKKRRIRDEVESEDSDEDDDLFYSAGANGGAAASEDGDADVAPETADEIRLRLAKETVEKVKAIAQREREDEDEEGGDSDEDRGHYAAAQILEQEQMERTGRLRRAIASKVQRPESGDGFRLVVKHRQSVTAVALSEDDLKGYSGSKDGIIVQWDVESGKSDKYEWPSAEVLKSHGSKDPQGRAAKHSKSVLALVVSTDGRYLATGGLDRHVHLWDTRTRDHIQAFPGHRGPVSSLAFRQGTSELFSGSFDRTIKIWNVEDRAYINTLFGHQSEVFTVDCLRKERLLSVGRDRTMQLFKVPEESRLVFRAPASSLECCCFISNDEYLSGSDDGSIELWNTLRKKPIYVVKNAHSLLSAQRNVEPGDNKMIPNGHIENGNHYPSSSADSWISSITVCRDGDVAASGAGDGAVRLWALKSEKKDIQPLFDLPLVGFVNSLAFARSGRFLVAGVGQEPRLGRWARNPGARNGVVLHSFRLLKEDNSFPPI